MFQKIISLVIISVISSFAFSQGKVRGKVTDDETGEAIPYVVVKAVQNGTMKLARKTDFDGAYSLDLPAGKYLLEFSNAVEGYKDQQKEVTVVNNEVLEVNIILSKNIQVIGPVTVRTAKIAGGGTDESLLNQQKDAKGAQNAIGTEAMNATGVGNASEAAAKVSGISVDGNVVYVRGLGDRYSKTLLNGMEIPGLDPDRNAVQMDIFPTTVIENITVYKTFLPNFTGDYTGGLVDITTREFPTKKTMYFSGGLGYNSQATFNSEYIGYKGGKLDFLAFDDGTRALNLPLGQYTKFPDATENDPELGRLIRMFNPTMATELKRNFMDQNYAFSLGNQIDLDNGKVKYGYNVVLNYRNTHRFYNEVQFGEFRKSPDISVNTIYADRKSVGQLAENDVLWSALFGQSVKFGKGNKVTLNLFHTQNGKSSASSLSQENYESNPGILEKTSLQFTQRSISNANLSGLHFRNKWKTEWKLSPTYSRISDPDLRSTALEVMPQPNGENTYLLTPAVGSEIRRIYRDLTEINASGRLDFTYTFQQWDSLESKLSFGGLNTYKTRSFDTYDLNFFAENLTQFSSDPNWYFQDENLWTVEKDSGMVVKGQREPANTFDGRINVAGMYVMNELPITEKFSSTYGVRVEKADYFYTGQNNNGTVKYFDQKVLDEISILPSVNLLHQSVKKADSLHYERTVNYRAAYSQTVARPSFKEKSIAQIYDPIQGRFYNGNIDLKQTTIHNADLRWEYFFGRTEMISASGFYKRFIDPIELVAFDLAPTEVKPVNAGVADVFGFEVEARKVLVFSEDERSNLLIGSNFTYVVSRIDMDRVLLNKGTALVSERTIRQENAREGQTIDRYRPMYGQSPYILNGFLTYSHDTLGLIVNLSYNVQGKKLSVIGVGKLPDVYEQPFHSLNFKASKTFGKDSRWKASASVQNILMNARRRSYESYGDNGAIDNRLYDYFYEGMTFSGSISLTLR